MHCNCMCAYLFFESIEVLLKIITILWGGVLICVIIFVPLQGKIENIFVKI